jgi:peptide/nickel transport system substrate-binding protein
MLVGCTKDEDNNGQTNIDNDNKKIENKDEKAAFGGTLKLTIREPITLNPLINQERSVDQLLRLVYEPLFSLDHNYKPSSNLVDSYVIQDNGMYITIKLKSNIYFHNGSLLTASDVKYSIDSIINTENSIYKSCVANIQRTAVMDQQTIRIYYKQPYAFSLYNLVFPIIPNGSPVENFKPIGTGPYKFVDFTVKKELNLKANDKWHKGKVYIENINTLITKDNNVEINSFEHHVIDLINPIKFDWIQYADNKNISINEYTSNYYEFVGFNFSNSLLVNPVVRKAIGKSINRKELVKEVLLNHYTLSDYPIQPKSWLNNENAESKIKYNVKEAKDNLEKAGYVDSDKDGFYDVITNDITSNITLTLLVNKDNKLRLSVAEKIKGYIETLGFKVDINGVDSNVFKERIKVSDFDLVLAGWKLSSTPDLTELFHSSRIGESNFINYSSANMDKALEGVFTSRNDDTLKNNIKTFKDIYDKELPYYSLYFLNSAIITNDKVKGKLKSNTDDSFKGIENLYIVE